LSWFPHHITMPTPTAIDRIAASLHDLATALLHPTPESPLAPLQSSQVAALTDLLEPFTAIMPNDDDVAPQNDELTITDPNPSDAPRLRVESEPAGVAITTTTYRDATKRKSRKRNTAPQPTATTNPDDDRRGRSVAIPFINLEFAIVG
jgi:hypothetical protein